jgi:predicted ATPase/DNA-binding SARP family transcriptional activator
LTVEIRLLGPVEVVDDDGGAVGIAGAKLRGLLASLALRAGQVVSADRLVEDLWGPKAKATAANSLQGLVSKLRRALPDGFVVTRPPGYVLDVPPETIDVGQFERLAAEGRRALGAGDFEAAAAGLGHALALWRGDALADFAYEDFARGEIARLQEARLAVFEDRVDAELACGRHSALVPELQHAVAASPLRERLRAQLISALYRSGRQADALREFQEARSVLAEQLGLEPGPELRRAEAAVLAHELSGAPALAPSSAVVEHAPTALLGSLTSFVGRETALPEIARLVDQSRLVTLTGPGGTGKTRLAIEFGARRQARGSTPVWLVELAPALDEASVTRFTAAAVGLRERAAPAPTPATAEEEPDTADRLPEYLKHKDALLILDNCEHVLDSVAELAAGLLQSCPRLRMLATSREPLGRAGEVQWPVPPLALPPRGSRDLAALAGVEAVQLFVDRASAVEPSFHLDPESAPAVVGICYHLDAIPLAIELVAARVKALPVEEIAARLDDQVLVLGSGGRDAAERHRTLRATVDWSYQLLDDAEQELFGRVSVFSGGCSLEAAEAAAEDAGMPRGAAIDLLARLVDKPLLSVDRASRVGTRYRMLEALRQYGLAQLADKGQLSEARRWHAHWSAHLATTSAAGLHGPEQRSTLDRLDADADNLRAALDWLTANGEIETALTMATALAWYWWVRGHQREGRAWLELATSLADTSHPGTAHFAAALAWAGHLAADHDLPAALTLAKSAVGAGTTDLAEVARAKLLLAGIEVRAGEHDRVSELLEEALVTLDSLGDSWGVAWAFNVACFDAVGRGDLGAAESACRESLSRFRTARDGWGTGRMVHKLAVIAELRGQDDDACALYEESLTFARSLGLDEVVAVMLAQLARIVARQGDQARAGALRDEASSLFHDLSSVDLDMTNPAAHRGIARRRSDLARAQGLFEESLVWYRQVASVDGALFSLASLGTLAELRADYPDARRVYQELLRTGSAAQRWGDVGVALQRLGLVAAAEGEPRRAASLAGAAAGVCERWGISGGPRMNVEPDTPAANSVFSSAFQSAYDSSDAQAVALGIATG